MRRRSFFPLAVGPVSRWGIQLALSTHDTGPELHTRPNADSRDCTPLVMPRERPNGGGKVSFDQLAPINRASVTRGRYRANSNLARRRSAVRIGVLRARLSS